MKNFELLLFCLWHFCDLHARLCSSSYSFLSLFHSFLFGVNKHFNDNLNPLIHRWLCKSSGIHTWCFIPWIHIYFSTQWSSSLLSQTGVCPQHTPESDTEVSSAHSRTWLPMWETLIEIFTIKLAKEEKADLFTVAKNVLTLELVLLHGSRAVPPILCSSIHLYLLAHLLCF